LKKNFCTFAKTNKKAMRAKTLFNDFIALFFPKLCVVCGESLRESEDFLCLHCLLDLPKTRYHSYRDNASSDRFLGKIPVEKSLSYLYYSKGGSGQKLIAGIKYQGNIRLGKWIGVQIAKEIQSTGFFEGIDYLIPVPLHNKKLKKRGFNQAEIIAQGISSVTRIPVEAQNLYRTKANRSQTRKGVYERWKNTAGIFQVKDLQLFAGKHILLIDDVLTTGATIEASATGLLASPEIKISLLTLAIA
jgi:ComF family protein